MRPKQARLLHPEPITDADALDAADFLAANQSAHASLDSAESAANYTRGVISGITYKCRCGNRLELHIRAEAVVCVRCGSKMRPQP